MGLFDKAKKIVLKNGTKETITSYKPKESRAARTRRITERTLTDFKNSNINEYTISDCGDQRVCGVCRKQHGKKYKTKDAVAGINAPPFCNECRCVVLPVFK